MASSDPLIAVVGCGRLGTLLADKLAAGSPRGRGASCDDADIALLCVPDHEITAAAAEIAPRKGLLVGHCSGATALTPVLAHGHEAFSMHPLMTVTEQGAQLEGSWAAVDGSMPAAQQVARDLALRLGMHPMDVPEGDRPAYHAAASISSNFLVTLEAFAERMGTERDALAPLVRATVENWAALGPQRALTGPIARGDEHTVAEQRAAVEQRAPEMVELFDALADATRALAASREVVA